jgi:tetratricopeptide (TPR) repeat protein
MEKEKINEITQNAIRSAIGLRWKEAEKLNKAILLDNPRDIDALNRQGNVYINLGECQKAKLCFEKALKLDPLNSIALKNLRLLRTKKFRHEELVPEKYNLKSVLKEPDKKTRQKTKPYIKHAGLEDEESLNLQTDSETENEDFEE